MDTTSLTGGVALITGASAGIGKATAVAFARLGIKVALVARRAEPLRALVADIAGAGGEAASFVADVGQEDQAVAAAKWAEDTFGAVDILVNNAGIIRPGPLVGSDSQGIRDTININLLAPMYLSKAVLPGMQGRGRGHIVNISSNAAKLPGSPGNASYSASKYGITALSAALRKEVAEHGIRVTVIEPGTTETDIADTIPDEKVRAGMQAYMHRDGVMQVEDIANAIVYAVSQPLRVNVNEMWLTPTR